MLKDKYQLLEVVLKFRHDKGLNKLLLIQEIRAREDLSAKSRDEIRLDYTAGIRAINGEEQAVAIKPEAIEQYKCEEK